MLYVILCMSPGRCWRWLPSPCCTSSSSRWWSWRWLAASRSAQRPPCTARPAPGQPGHGHVTQIYMWYVARGQHLQQSVEAADAVSELLLIFLHQRGGWRLHVARLQVLLRLWLTLMALRFSLDLVSTLLCCCHLNLNGMEELVWQISKIER